jgi:REP element-mobilizing transposase RayT
MARRPRLELAGGYFHVTSRGNRRQPVFTDRRDRQRFLVLLDDVVTRHQWRCHAYCLMGNHYHLVLETPEANLSSGMWHLNGLYAQAFNRRHEVDGHLFQRRFHSILVESDWHMLELTRYVVLNPVRAGVCPHPGDWAWSSYRATAGIGHVPRLLTVDWLLGHFGPTRRQATSGYRAFIDEGRRPIREHSDR